METKHPAPTFGQHLEIAPGFCRLDDSEGVFLVGNREILGVIARDLQENAAVRSALVGLPGRVQEPGAELQTGRGVGGVQDPVADLQAFRATRLSFAEPRIEALFSRWARAARRVSIRRSWPLKGPPKPSRRLGLR
jgi:hypothetical protein